MCLVVSDSCNPVDFRLPCSSVHGILQASGLPFPSPGGLPDLGIEPGSSALQADSLLTELREKPHLCISSVQLLRHV